MDIPTWSTALAMDIPAWSTARNTCGLNASDTPNCPHTYTKPHIHEMLGSFGVVWTAISMDQEGVDGYCKRVADMGAIHHQQDLGILPLHTPR